MGSGGGKQTIGYWYGMGMHMVLCHGPVDAVLELRAGGRTFWTGEVSKNTQLYIDQPDLFGGEKKEGGIKGYIDIAMGGATQGPNDYLQSQLGSAIPNYRGVLSLILRQVWLTAMTPYIKPWAAKVKRIAAGWNTPVWYPTKIAAGSDGGMNPAHIVYQCYTDPVWGMGYPPSAIDEASFTAAADQLHAEGFGLSLMWSQQTSIGDFVQIVADHVGAILGVNPRTGKFTFKLIRDDYDPANLPVFDESNIAELVEYQRASWGETVNEITVTYEDAATGKTAAITVQDIASIEAQGGVISQTKNYPGLTNGTLAARVAMRDLRLQSTPLAKVTLKVNRAAWTLTPGDVFRLTWPKLGISALICRVLRVDGGTLTDGTITIDAAEDVFGLPANAHVEQEPSAWADPATLPAPAPYSFLAERTYWDIVRNDAPADVALYTADTSFVQGIGQRPSGDALNFDFLVWPSGEVGEIRATGDFCPVAVLVDALPAQATSTVTVTSDIDLDLVEVGTYAQIDDELVGVTAIDLSTKQVSLDRGVLDTTPAPHAAGARIFFWDGWAATDPREFTTENISAKLLTRTGRGELPETEAPTLRITLVGRWSKPYPPGNFQINGRYYPEEITDAEMLHLTWAHRDRTQQTATLVPQTAGSIGPETGVTYNIRIYDGGGTEVATLSGYSGTSYNWAPPTDGTYRITLGASRDGVASYQQHDHTLTFKRPLSEISAGNYIPLLNDGTRLLGSTIVTDPQTGDQEARIVWSTDSGLTWTAGTEGIRFAVKGLAYGLGKYVANGGGGNWFGIASTHDGAWTIEYINTFPIADIGGGVAFCPVLFDGTRFVVAGDFGIIMTRTDTVGWAEVSGNNLQHVGDIRSIVWDGTHYWCHLSAEVDHVLYWQVYKSPDLVTWTKKWEGTKTGRTIIRVLHVNGQIFFCGSKTVDGRQVPWLMTTTDGGTTWHDISPVPSGTAGSKTMSSLAYFAGKWVMFGGNVYGYSSDLVTWTLTETYPNIEGRGYPVQDANALLCGAYYNGPYDLLRSTDGMTWAVVNY